MLPNVICINSKDCPVKSGTSLDSSVTFMYTQGVCLYRLGSGAPGPSPSMDGVTYDLMSVDIHKSDFEMLP